MFQPKVKEWCSKVETENTEVGSAREAKRREMGAGGEIQTGIK